MTDVYGTKITVTLLPEAKRFLENTPPSPYVANMPGEPGVMRYRMNCDIPSIEFAAETFGVTRAAAVDDLRDLLHEVLQREQAPNRVATIVATLNQLDDVAGFA